MRMQRKTAIGRSPLRVESAALVVAGSDMETSVKLSRNCIAGFSVAGSVHFQYRRYIQNGENRLFQHGHSFQIAGVDVLERIGGRL